ncbi:L-threonylcarbamoyladenylate synthase [Mangrovimonas sp. TPBH4]|uniref:L-threonylcarbamoyladenylate synthase n=1 Tax=Mangrovimonas sp. TPBH4 TaxID=1645914 RepID=UPI0006B61AC7|nr:L-threonylcarbamoyladenylate synthase [Mangrovimonas sp. TPBH4]
MNSITKETIEASKILQLGGTILYPTDTVWGIGCDASNPEAVQKVYELKQRSDSKALICLVADERMLKKYVKDIPAAAPDFFDIPGQPITIIYDGPQNLAPNLVGSDDTIAIRIPDNDFCFQLLRKFNGAIVSTSANISGQPTPTSFEEISEEILKGVDYVVNLPSEKSKTKPSSIIKLSKDGKVKIIRK